MVTEVIMPKLGQTMEEGKIARWVKKEGDRVEKGDVLLEITTDKATLEVEAYGSGILRKILAKEGETVPVTQLIGIVAEEGEELPDLKRQEKPETGKTAEKTETPKKQETKSALQAAAASSGKKTKASPLAKKIASQKGIDLSALKGTGPGGRIVKEDVLSAVPGGEPARPSRMREAIAAAMSKSKKEIPHFYLTSEVQMKEVARKRENLEGVSYTHVIIKAVADALSEFPALNATWEDGKIVNPAEIRIGIAVGVEDGIITPVLSKPDKKTLQEISTQTKQIVERAKAKKLSVDEYSNATFTISNLGMFGVESFLPIIIPPQACILGIGTIVQKCVVIDGNIEIGPVMKISLSADHRIVDGIAAATFTQKLTDILENPDFM